MATQDDRSSDTTQTVIIKKYANRRLYNTESSAYVTLDDLARMVRSDRDFVVRDAKTGDDLTHAVLTQIIVEQEAKGSGPTLLPIPFLRQLIRYYDDSIGKMVPSYLQFSMAALAKEQERFRSQFSNWGPNAFEAYQEQARKNLEMFEQAMAVWSPRMGDAASYNPFAAEPQTPTSQPGPEARNGAAHPNHQPPEPEAADGPPASAQAHEDAADDQQQTVQLSEIDQLKAELAAMQAKIERISRSTD
jgi:polyhydroxyalkanoate synthesis repressor PhaR